MVLKKNVLLICGVFFFPLIIFSQSPPAQNGFGRVIRQGHNWDWGTYGHGTFDDAVRLFAAEKEVVMYKDGTTTYRVFTTGNKNYVEMNKGWSGGIFTYTTKADPDEKLSYLSGNGITSQTTPTNDILNKVTRKNDQWSWGTFDHGTFDQAAHILKEEANIIKFTDPNDPKINYRIFTHGSLNYIEMNCGWRGGIFAYTTNN